MRAIDDGSGYLFQADLANIANNFPQGTHVASSGLAVSSDGLDMTLDVTAGDVAINGNVQSIAAGTVTLPAADTFRRYDLVVVDNTYSLGYIKGTQEKTTPALPSDNVLLAIVRVPANATAIASGDVLDARVYSTLGDQDTIKTNDLFLEGANTKVNFDNSTGSSLIENGDAATLITKEVAPGDQFGVYEAGLTDPAGLAVPSGVSLRIIEFSDAGDGTVNSDNVVLSGDGTTAYPSATVPDFTTAAVTNNQAGACVMALVVDNGHFATSGAGQAEEVVTHATTIVNSETGLTIG